MISTKGTTHILGGEFRGNRAEDRGAVILSDHESATDLAGGVFMGNFAADGAVVFVQSNSLLSVSGGELCDNEARKRGGAFCVTENGSIKVGEGMRRPLGLCFLRYAQLVCFSGADPVFTAWLQFRTTTIDL